MPKSEDDSIQITKGAWTLIIIYGLSISSIWYVYTEIFRNKIADWSGIKITNDWFGVGIILLTAVVWALILIRYKSVLDRIDDHFFIQEETNLSFKSMGLALTLISILMILTLVILLSVLAFILGTGFSLGMFSQPDMTVNESVVLLLFFILGVTFVTLAISEALKLIDNYLIIESRSEVDSQKIEEIYAMLISQSTGQFVRIDSAPKDEEE